MNSYHVTARQREMVRESYPAVREMATPVSLLFYGRLFELNPALRPLFRRDIQVQGRKLMDTLSAIVDQMDDFEGMLPNLRAMGQRHQGYGVSLADYETVERALVWALGQALDTRFYPELKAAWTAVIKAMGGAMCDGAAELKM